MASQTPLVCPSFCPSDCTYMHHELLMTLLDCSNLEGDKEREESFKCLKSVITKWENTGVWTKESVIPDDNVSYRFSMMHWACALGKPYLVEWLVKEGFSSAVQHGESGDTGLHRVLVCLQKSNCKDPEIAINKMLPYLSDCFTVKNNDGNNPFQLACRLLDADTTLKTNKFFASCITSLIETAKVVDTSGGLLLEMLDSQNNDGNTGVHILAQHDRNFNTLKMCVSGGANLLLRNNLGINAFEVAINCGQSRNSKFLDAQLKKQKSKLDTKCLSKPKDCTMAASPSVSKAGTERPSTSTNNGDEIKILPRLRRKRKRLSTDSSEESVQSLNLVTTSGQETTPASKFEEMDSSVSSDDTTLICPDSRVPDVGKGFLAYLQNTGYDTRTTIISTINRDRNRILQEMTDFTERLKEQAEKYTQLEQLRDLKKEEANSKLEELMELQQDISDVESKLGLLEQITRSGPRKIAKLKEKLKSCDLALTEMQVLSNSDETIILE